MDTVPYVDNLINEYLIFRGYIKTFTAFASEKLSDKVRFCVMAVLARAFAYACFLAAPLVLILIHLPSHTLFRDAAPCSTPAARPSSPLRLDSARALDAPGRGPAGGCAAQLRAGARRRAVHAALAVARFALLHAPPRRLCQNHSHHQQIAQKGPLRFSKTNTSKQEGPRVVCLFVCFLKSPFAPLSSPRASPPRHPSALPPARPASARPPAGPRGRRSS